MSSFIRILENVARPMQRLGYLKRLLKRVIAQSTSNLENIGYDLVNSVSKKESVPISIDRAVYIKSRLRYGSNKELLKIADEIINYPTQKSHSMILMELQDLYLADPNMPSSCGKLVKNDWRKYPYLGINLGFIRPGTYSANTRSLSLMYLTKQGEIDAFSKYQPEFNPLLIDKKQSLIFLYSLLKSDGEVITSLWNKLISNKKKFFTDRDVGDLLPEIYNDIISRHRKRILSVEDRDKLLGAEKSAYSITQAKTAKRYVGSAREEASRPRVEPYVDIEILKKTDPAKYEFYFSPIGLVWAKEFGMVTTSEGIRGFLENKFISVANIAYKVKAVRISKPDRVVPFLYNAWKAIKSAGGYSPIEEIALLGGIEALFDHKYIINLSIAKNALVKYQKANPYKIRFTVNRSGEMAHVRFLNEHELNNK